MQYFAVEWTRTGVGVCTVVAPALWPKPASRLKSDTRKVFGLGAKGQGLVVQVYFLLTFSLHVEMEDCRHCFCSSEL